MDYCIVYISSTPLSEDELIRLTQRSQTNNRALGITGVLLYFNGSVIEVLEGEQEKVNSLYEVIKRDPRHHQLIKLYDHSIPSRSFSDWFVGYKTISATEMDQFKSLIPLMEKSAPQSQNRGSVIMGLVKIFYQDNYRN
ncbi:BLUF domain-containing protein [Spirosoma sp. SC4-14]|uniref:BLUF domain-containing protein n=1 Tax=Spirosoma sp. SC4-14 TaxID=3128900 RepID=UPI0030D10FEE